MKHHLLHIKLFQLYVFNSIIISIIVFHLKYILFKRLSFLNLNNNLEILLLYIEIKNSFF
jgi:hypothetical protein